MEHLARFGARAENLFLESGDPLLLNEIQDCLDAGKRLPEDFATEKHLHSVAEVLLRFLDSLPTPLVAESALQDLPSNSPVDRLLQRLPAENASLCRYLLGFARDLLTSHDTPAPSELAAVLAKVLLQDHSRELDRLGSILASAMK